MKKRFLSLMLAGILAFGGSCNVFAEEADTELQTEEAAAVPEVNWEDVAPSVEEAAEWKGDFVNFDEIAIKMYVPDVLIPAELTEEDKEAGYIGYFTTEDETATASVMYVDVDGMSLDEYQAYLEGEEDVDEVEAGIINGVPVVTYSMPENDVACVSIATEKGYILEFSFYPMSDEGFEAVAQIMMVSIQAEE